MKYLIEIHHGIGDVVQMTGIIETIYTKDCDAMIDLVLYSENRSELFKNDKRVNKIFYVNLHNKCRTKLIKALISMRKQKYDYAFFSPISNVKGTRILAKIVSAKKSVGEQFKKNNHRYISVLSNKNDHIVKRNNNLLLQSGFSDSVYNPILRGIEYKGSNSLTTIGLCIGTSKPSKTWDQTNYIYIAEQLEKIGYIVYFIGGKSEREGFPIELFKEHSEWNNFLGKTDLIESAELLEQCSVVVGGDTGIMHIAAALDVPTITLFSCSDPSLHAPYSDKSYVLTANISCQYCYETGGYDSCHQYRCLEGITVEMVLEAIVGVIKNNAEINEIKYIK